MAGERELIERLRDQVLHQAQCVHCGLCREHRFDCPRAHLMAQVTAYLTATATSAEGEPTPCMMHSTEDECRAAQSCASDGGPVSVEVYTAAVRGRQEFRRAYREMRDERDRLAAQLREAHERLVLVEAQRDAARAIVARDLPELSRCAQVGGFAAIMGVEFDEYQAVKVRLRDAEAEVVRLRGELSSGSEYERTMEALGGPADGVTVPVRCGGYAGGVPRLGIAFACCLAKGHDGEHRAFDPPAEYARADGLAQETTRLAGLAPEVATSPEGDRPRMPCGHSDATFIRFEGVESRECVPCIWQGYEILGIRDHEFAIDAARRIVAERDRLAAQLREAHATTRMQVAGECLDIMRKMTIEAERQGIAVSYPAVVRAFEVLAKSTPAAPAPDPSAAVKKS